MSSQNNIFKNNNIYKEAVLNFVDSTLFNDTHDRYEEKLFCRKIKPQLLEKLDFSSPLKINGISSFSALYANRVLFAMNDTDFLYLPEDNETLNFDDFTEFYNPARVGSAYIAMPYLENYLFSFLKDEIIISDNWDLKLVEKYFSDYANDIKNIKTSETAEAIRTSKNPKNSAKELLIQLAPDFLIESSPMARYTPGSYGNISSALFKVIIDELGYGDFSKKHSTLFKDTLQSVGLSRTPHKYWQYYLNGSLLLANYYNMITRVKRNIFKYIGAIYLAETTFITSCKIWMDVLKEALPGIDTLYFSEHCHIDHHHSKTVLNEIVLPTIVKYGNQAANEIVRGFEEAKLIGEIADKDFIEQIAWKDNADKNIKLFKNIFEKVKKEALKGNVKTQKFLEPKGELSITHSHDQDELCYIRSGQMEFLNGFEKSTILKSSEGIIINKNRLHGAIIQSSNCEYEIYTIENINKWL
ncbi:helix-turn-helix transcriptional regulator [Candidatus Hepatincola sp. Av]